MIRALLIPSLLASGLWLSPAAMAEGHFPERQILTVSATGTERIQATVADVRLAVEERGLTDEEARSRMARRSNRLLEYLREAGVERLETTSLRLHPIYDYTKGDREIVGYQAMSVIRFRSESATVGPVIDEAIARGANQVQDLLFTAPEAEIEAARQRALRTAVKVGMQRADTVLEELRLERKEIVRVHLDPVDPEPPFVPLRGAEARAMATERPPSDLEAGEPAVTASVTLEIAY